MFTTHLVNLYNRNIFKTSLYIYIFQDEKCRLMRNLSLSMVLWHNRQICGTTAKSVEWQPNLWYDSQIVAWRPNLRHGGQICGTAAKLWYGGNIFGMAAKFVARRTNLWPGSQICGTATKSENKSVNLCTKEQKFEYILPSLS